jgi:hypothetical protein
VHLASDYIYPYKGAGARRSCSPLWSQGGPKNLKQTFIHPSAWKGCSAKFEVLGELTDLGCAADEQRTRQGSTERVSSAVLVCDGDHAVHGANLFYGE